MGLSNAEIVRLRAELGYNAVQIGNPYLTAYALFETVIQTYVEAGGETTSSTAVTGTGSPVPATLTLAAIPTDTSGDALVSGDQVIIDVDARLERATIQSLTGLDIVVSLSLTHSGTYRVMCDGGVAMVREKLSNIRKLSDQIQTMSSAAGVKKADEVEFFGSADLNHTIGPAGALWQQREWERKELADFIGVVYLRAMRRGNAASGLVVY